MKHTKELLKMENTFTCDECGKETDTTRRCSICHKDLCAEHLIYDDLCSGDYPPKYCKKCWTIGEPYRKSILALQISTDLKIERLENKWREECLNEKN